MTQPFTIDLWTDALESGRFTQAHGYLNANGEHCCLGVLCELAIEAGVPLEKTERDARTVDGRVVYCYDNDAYGIPVAVQEWSGINADAEYNPEGRYLSYENDTGKTFTEIAQIIRDNKETLFA